MKVNLLFLIITIYNTSCQTEDITNTMDSLEKDKILACAEIVSRKFQADAKVIEEVTSTFGEDKEKATSKISAEMFTNCMNRIDDASARLYFKDLEFMEFEWSDDLNKFVGFDYSKFKDKTDFEFTPDQHLLFYKLEQVRTEYVANAKQRTEKEKNTLKVAGIDLNNIGAEFKLLYFLIVIGIIAVGLLYLLSKVMKKEKVPKKKKNK